MAYKINRHDEYVVAPDGVATIKDVSRLRSELIQFFPEFYELEPAEIIKIYLDEEDLPYIGETEDRDWSYYGWALVRMAISSKNEEDYINVSPLNSNIKEYPLPGEIVIVVEYFGKYYYTQKINLSNSVNINSNKGLSKWTLNENEIKHEIKSFNYDSDIAQVKAEEGDIIFNGRFGQSIKFGSNIKEIIDENGDLDPDTGIPQSPNVLIRTGQGEVSIEKKKPVTENIDLDGSSLWMTTNQKVSLNFSNNKTPGFYSNSLRNNLTGNQIVLNSDKIIFNARNNEISLTSSHFISLSANDNIGLEVPNDIGNVQLGDAKANQPVLGGDLTMELFEKLIGYLIEFANGIKGAQGSVVDFVIPISDILPSSMGLAASLKELKTRMDEPKSKTVNVGHMRGQQ